MKKICEWCGEEFKTFPSKILLGRGKHCSRYCSSQAQRKREERICVECGRLFTLRFSEISKGGGKYCSYKCRKQRIAKVCVICDKPFETKRSDPQVRYCSVECCNKDRTNFQSGEKNPNWQGGKHSGNYSYAFNKIKPIIRKRDSFICGLCYAFGNHVHHINYDKKDISFTNLIVLCSSCHGKTGSKNKRDAYRVILQGKINDMPFGGFLCY